MKRIILLLCLVLAISFTSCSSNSPKSVAISFLEELNEGDFDGAKKYTDSSTKSMLDLALSFGADKMKEEMKKSKVKSFEVEKEEIDGEKANVTVKAIKKGTEGGG